MKTIHILFIIIIMSFLSSCASDYKKHRNAPIQPYIDSLDITHYRDVYEHPNYGRLEVKDEPLKSISEECTIKAYKDVKLHFDEVEISDPDILYEINADYIRHLFNRYPYTSLPAMAFRKMKDNHNDQWLVLGEASGMKTRCIKDQGWRFLKRGK